MNTIDPLVEAGRILSDLRASSGEFGYRAQALFAETLAWLGGQIDVVARVGRPDIIGRMAGRVLRIEVKATRQASFTLDARDLEGIRPRSSLEEGYLAVLVLRPPLEWICVSHRRARAVVGRLVPLAMLRAMEDNAFSTQCTEMCAHLVIENRENIEAFTFSLLRKRALDDDLDHRPAS